jgi:hypothetical protein
LGEILLELGRVEEALEEFEKCLDAFPHRLRSHLGAFVCARRLGRTEVSQAHESHFHAMTDGSFVSRQGLDSMLASRSLSHWTR